MHCTSAVITCKYIKTTADISINPSECKNEKKIDYLLIFFVIELF